MLARWLPASMSLPHPKFLKPVASSPDQVVMLPCHVLGLFYLLCLLDTLLLRFIQSGPSDQDSDLGATGILHTLALLDCPLLTTRFLQISTSLFMVRLNNIFRYGKCLAVSKSASLVSFQFYCTWPNAAKFLFDA